MSDKPTIAITFPNHWSIKNLIHSGLLAEITPHVHVIGLAAQHRIVHLKKLCTELGLSEVDWQPIPMYKESWLLRMVRQSQKSLLFEKHGLATEKILKSSKRGRRTLVQKIGSTLFSLIAGTGFGKSLFEKFSRLRYSETEPASLILDHLPDVLFCTNPVDYREDALVKWAKTLGIRVVTMIPSWDNLSSKGVLFTKFDAVYVWNKAMQSEMLKLYPEYPHWEIPIVGIPRLQAFTNPLPSEWERDSYLIRLGLDPSKKTILFANTATSSFPDQPVVARQIASAIQYGEISNVQMIVRCHPHDQIEDYDDLRRLPNVRVWPSIGEPAFGVQTVPPADDLLQLHAVLNACDVCVNTASTIVLDAAAMDLPIVSVAYDGERTLPYTDSCKSFYNYTHQRTYLASNAGVFCETRQELIREIQKALDDRTIRSQGRKELVEKCLHPDPVFALKEELLKELNVRLDKAA